MTLSIVPVDQAGIDNIADGLSGFTDESSELQQSMMTTLFIAGASDASKGRCAYLLLEDGSRMWVPNSLRCWIVDLQIKTQQYESYDPVEKLFSVSQQLMGLRMCTAAALTAGLPRVSSRSSNT